MKYPPAKSFEVTNTVQIYKLLQIGLNYMDIKNISFEDAENLMLLYDEIKSYESEQMEKAKK